MPQPHLAAFQIDAEHGSHAYVIRIRGELDLAGCPALELALTEAEQSQAERIRLDLEQLTFVDARGLNVLLQAGNRSASNGDRLRITRANGQVARMFRLTTLETALPFADRAPLPKSARRREVVLESRRARTAELRAVT